MNKALKVLVVFWSILCLLLVIDHVVCGMYCGLVGDFFRHAGKPSGDAAVVFFGDYDFQERELGAETIKRLRHAAFLVNSGAVDEVLCVGGSGFIVNFGDYGSVMMKRWLTARLGVEPARVMVDTLSYDSVTNYHEALSVARRSGWRRIVLVSSASHLYRLARFETPEGIGIALAPHSKDCIESYADFHRMRGWIHHEFLALAALAVLPPRVYGLIMGFLR